MEKLSGIHRNGIIVRLNVSIWEGRKYDKKVTEKVEENFGSKDSGRWNKILIARDAVKKYGSIAKEARNIHYSMTLPWGDNGDRILPANMISEYKVAMRAIANDFEYQVERFCESYPALIEQAREKLNGMFNPDDYPSATTVRGKFNMAYNFLPVPMGSDFRCDIQEDEIEEIRKETEEYHRTLAERAKRALWERIYYPLARLVERLSKSDATFRDSLIGNIWEVLNIVDKLNFEDDPNILNIKQRIGSMLEGMTPEAIREDRKIRTQVEAEATLLMESIAKTINVDPKATMRKLRLERGIDEDKREISTKTRIVRV